MIKLILRGDVSGLGRRGEIVQVSDGYARNFLIPKGLAIRSHAGAEAQAAAMVKARDTRDARERAAAEEIARVLAPITIRVEARAAGDKGRLFGSVSPNEIAEAVFAQTGLELDRRTIEISDPIKSVGSHSVAAHLHRDVKLFLQIEVTGR